MSPGDSHLLEPRPAAVEESADDEQRDEGNQGGAQASHPPVVLQFYILCLGLKEIIHLVSWQCIFQQKSTLS